MFSWQNKHNLSCVLLIIVHSLGLMLNTHHRVTNTALSCENHVTCTCMHMPCIRVDMPCTRMYTEDRTCVKHVKSTCVKHVKSTCVKHAKATCVLHVAVWTCSTHVHAHVNSFCGNTLRIWFTNRYT